MVNQPSPKGFGDAVLRTRPFTADEAFLVHAGDDIIYPNNVDDLRRLLEEHYYRHRPKSVFLYDVSSNPERYGVIVCREADGYMEVDDIIEKPERPPSNRVVIAVYIFDRGIYDALTDAIRYLLKRGEKIHAVRVSGRRLNLGTPDQYFHALKNMGEVENP